MGTRLELQQKLKTLAPNVYFTPPEDRKMVYPCILYDIDDEFKEFADNKPYAKKIRYLITVIDKDPDSSIPGLVSALPLSRFVRRFTADQLNHTLYNLYF